MKKQSQKLLLNVSKAIEVMFPETIKKQIHLNTGLDIAAENEISQVMYGKENIMEDEELQKCSAVVYNVIGAVKNLMKGSPSENPDSKELESPTPDRISQVNLHIVMSVLMTRANQSVLISKLKTLNFFLHLSISFY